MATQLFEADVKKLVTAFRADGCGNLGCLFEGVLESQDHPYGCICDATRIETMDELRKHIHNAKDKGAVVRVVGSQHSASMRKYLHDGGKPIVLVGEEKFQKIVIDISPNGQEALCTAGGGCELREVCEALNQKGFAIPELGGISLQTVGGFMATGSAGGSLKYSFSDAIEEIVFVDGTGKTRTARHDDQNKDTFYAVGVSMGLFGVITQVTFRVEKAYYVEGEEYTVQLDSSSLKDGKTLKDSLKSYDYFHVNWFPQANFNHVLQWTGRRLYPDEFHARHLEIIPYKHPLQSIVKAVGAWVLLWYCDQLLSNPDEGPGWQRSLTVGRLLNMFVPLGQATRFRDWWNKVLPNDNQAHNNILKIDFTEIWLPSDECEAVLKKLKSLFEEDPLAAGNFTTEIYGAKKSPFWLSMSYGGDCVRVDSLWFHYNGRNMNKFFSRFWKALLPIEGARLHWGKVLPEPEQTFGPDDSRFTYPERLKEVFPKMKEWLDMRQKMDPDQVFVTEYWRTVLGIPSKASCCCN